jgi:hypothetical protein
MHLKPLFKYFLKNIIAEFVLDQIKIFFRNGVEDDFLGVLRAVFQDVLNSTRTVLIPRPLRNATDMIYDIFFRIVVIIHISIGGNVDHLV